jgi:thiol:disulfide interchange protein DsbD
MLWVRKLMGWVLIGMAAYFIRPILPNPMDVLLMAIIAVSGGVYLGWIDPSKAGFRFFEWIRTGAGLAGLIIATVIMGSWLFQMPGVEWKPYSDQLLTAAKKFKKPVIMDFYAGWCSPCRKLDEVTFHDVEVVKQATSDFIMIKVDLTGKGSSDHGHLLQHYGIKGVPTVVFLDSDGTERRDLRLVDYLPPDRFLIRMFELKMSKGRTHG